MGNYLIRKAVIGDVDFLVETIIESKKSGTNKLSYSTVFGLSEEESRKYISEMLLEQVDDCELSISSFLVAENEGKAIAAVSAWIEGKDGIPSSILKSNLLNYILPKKYIENAISLDVFLRDLQMEYLPNSIQIGWAYVTTGNRGCNLAGKLINEQINLLLHIKPDLIAAFLQVYEDNIPAIKAYEKVNFKIEMVKESSNEEILKYLPSKRKILMKRELRTE
jgi:hypothetical protein